MERIDKIENPMGKDYSTRLMDLAAALGAALGPGLRFDMLRMFKGSGSEIRVTHRDWAYAYIFNSTADDVETIIAGIRPDLP